MNISLPGHSAPAVGFEVPLEMLAACHLRVQDQCATLLRLVPHIAAQGSDRPAQQAAAAVMRYFDTSARHHHEDEERDLFPALIESMAGSDAVCLRELTVALTAEHRELEACWQRLRAVLAQVAAGQAAVLAQDEVDRFTGLYERHIAREEAELLPMAQRLLSDTELDRIGLAMRLRRAVPSAPTLEPPASPAALIDHILARFHAVHRQQLPEMIRLAAQVEAVHADHPAAPRGLTALLQTLHAELLAHMEKEETILFPMLAQGGNAFVVHPIGVMRAEHEEHAARLAELMALTHDASAPDDACTTWRQLSAAVRQFADDLQQHIQLENEVLFPQFGAHPG